MWSNRAIWKSQSWWSKMQNFRGDLTMTNEEMEGAMEFLLKNQAAFEARQSAVDARFEAEREQTNQQIRELVAAQQGTQRQLDATQRQLDHLSVVVASIAEVTQRNSADIDALIKLVGGVIEGRNGKTES